jgi:hypothetical protein
MPWQQHQKLPQPYRHPWRKHVKEHVQVSNTVTHLGNTTAAIIFPHIQAKVSVRRTITNINPIEMSTEVSHAHPEGSVKLI